MSTTEVTTFRWHMALCVILLVLGVRCTVAWDPFPGWSGDPLMMEAPITGLTPAVSVGLDVLTLVASAFVLAGCSQRGWRPRAWELGSFGLGAAVVAWHVTRPGAVLTDITQGSQWLAAFGAGLACVQACRDARARRLVAGALVGIGIMVALKGGYQVFVEHPQVYKEFLRNRAQVLGANGWSEGSPMALAYERRISQADATGWFGLSNVFSTVMAAGMTVSFGLGLMGLASPTGGRGRGVSLGLLVIAGVFGAGVWLSHSKGGVAAALIGLGLLACGWVVRRSKWRVSPRAAGLACAMLPFAALAAVVVRGLVGERLSELSIYFRWFYLEGAARVVAESPLLGVGPDGFKEAYVRLKPALSPEEVSSPHSWFVDLIATLGVGGWAWTCWVVGQIWRGGQGLALRESEVQRHVPKTGRGTLEEGGGTRDEVRWLLVLFGLVTAASALFEHRIATVDGTLLRVVSLAGAVAAGGFVVSVMRSWEESGDRDVSMTPAVPLVAAVVAAVAHCQIEMTGITPGAVLWVLLLIATGASLSVAREPARVASSGTVRGRVGAGMMACAAFAPAAMLPSLAYWEHRIRDATSVAEPVPLFTQRAGALAAGRLYTGDSIESLARDLSASIGRPVPPTLQGVGAALEQVRKAAIEQSAQQLAMAQTSGVLDFQTARALSRLQMILALSEATEAGRREGIGAAEGVMRAYVDRAGESASAWAWVGTMRKTVFEATRDPEDARRAAVAFESACTGAPYEPLYRVELARLMEALGNRALAAKWANEALRLNENLRLDPLRQMGVADLEEMGRLAGMGQPEVVPPSKPPTRGGGEP